MLPNAHAQPCRWQASRAVRAGAREGCVDRAQVRDAPAASGGPTLTLSCGAGGRAVALESTGVYWVPIYELLEQRGVTPYLVNGRFVKMVPGRKSDWNAAQWLQKLHSLGLLQVSFRPDGELVAFRTLVRYRAELIQHRAPPAR